MGGYGESGGATWKFNYNSQTGVVGTPSVLTNIPATVNNVVAVPDNSTFVASTTTDVLYYYTNNEYYPIMDTFFTNSPTNTNNIISFDFQNSTGKILAVGANFDLYLSSQTMLPRQLLTTNYVPPVQAGSVNLLYQYGVGTLTPSTPANLYRTMTIGGDVSYTWGTGIGSYKVNDNQIITCRRGFDNATAIGYYQTVHYSLPNYTETAQATFPVGANGFASSFCGLTYDGLDGTIYMVLGVDGDNNMFIAVINNINDNYQQTYNLPDKASSIINPTITAIAYGNQGYIAITNNNIFSLYSVSGTLASYPLNFSLVLSTPLSFSLYGVAFQPVSGNVPYIYSLAGTSGATSLGQLIFTGNYASYVDNSVFNDISPNFYDGCICSNTQLSEFYVPRTSNGIVEVWNGELFLGNVSGITTSANPLNYIYSMPTIDNTFTWDLTTQGGTTVPVGGVAISKVNPNTVYALNTSGVAYKGILNNNAITFTADALITNTYTSINTASPATTLYNSNIYSYGLKTGQTVHNEYRTNGFGILGLSGNDVDGNFIATTSAGSNNLICLPAVNTGASNTWPTNWVSTLTGANAIFVANGANVDAGPYNIYSYSRLIDAINTAYAIAFNKFPSGSFDNPPTLSLNSATGLLTLNFDSSYTKSDAGAILMNNALLQICYFPSSVDTLDNTMNDIYLPFTNPATTTITQTGRSLYAFNQLDKIVFITNTIYVAGSFLGNNNTNNIITTVDVPTANAGYFENLGEVLYYQPNFLRPFILASSNPLQRIQLSVYYTTIDGTEYPLLVAPGTNWNATLIFPRRF